MTMSRNSPEERLAAAIKELVGGGGPRYGMKHDATGIPTSNYAHGPGGLFSYPGVDPSVFSAILGTEPGIIGMLPKFPTVFTNPLFTTVTGVQDDVGTEPDAVCDPAIVAGLLKACTLTAVFGRVRRQTRELYINRLGQRNDPGDPSNLLLMNGPMMGGADNDSILHPDMAPQAGTQILNNEISKVLFELGVSVNRTLNRLMYAGNPANNTSGQGYMEFPGLDILIGTEKVDAITGTTCPALDSDIKNFNYGKVDEESNGTDIVEVATYLFRYVRNNARRSGMMPVQWVWAMREELFYELTAVWPCSYLTYRCAFRADSDQARVNVDARDAIDFRDDMRRNQYLLIDGIRVPVVLDDGIVEESQTDSALISPGCFASDMYLIPLTVLGGTPVTYMEYFQHNNANIQAALGDGHLANQVWTTNNGAWIWTAERTRLCVFWEGKVEPRLIMRTPQLAGRILNVQYCPLQHTAQPFPDDPYFKNGGVTTRTGPSYYNEW